MGSERNAQFRSPSTPSPSRLVASTRTPGHPRRDAFGEACYRVEQVLTVVEHDEQSLRGKELDDAAVERRARPRVHAQACWRPPAPWLRGRSPAASSQNHAPSGKRGQDLGRHLHRQARLAHTADASQRDEPRRHRTPRRPRSSSSLATDERRELEREVPRERVERSQRRELARQARGTHLEHLLGARRDRGAGAHRDRRGRPRLTPASRRTPRSLSDTSMTAVRGGHQARRTVHGAAVVVAVAQLGLARVQAHADLQRARRIPRMLSRVRAARRPRHQARRARSRTPRAHRRPSS